MKRPKTSKNRLNPGSGFYLLYIIVILNGSILNVINAANIASFKDWAIVDRTEIETKSNSIIIKGGYIVDRQILTNAEMIFNARAQTNAEQVQIWGGLRFNNRNNRYVFAFRGGNNNDFYIARYASGGKAEFLGFAPLGFKPIPGIWYRLRIVAFKNRIQIYLGDEALPRINVADDNPGWNSGCFYLGGGWIPAEFADVQVSNLDEQEKSVLLKVGDTIWTPPTVDKELLRERERAAYKPIKIAALDACRTTISLNGGWLFMPDYQSTGGQLPVGLDYNDQQWHVMDVPAFWTPGLPWLYGETGFPGLRGLSPTKGVAESLTVKENARVSSYTFDWRKAKAAWYREYVILPPNIGEKHFELAFDAVAQVSDIWVNGIRVGNHTGMFAQAVYDISRCLKPGRNVIAVHVTAYKSTIQSQNVKGVAVTENVTDDTLYFMPHGMFQPDVMGIWQPVTLTVTAPILVKDCFVNPSLHGANIDLEVVNAGNKAAAVEADYTITSSKGLTILYTNKTPITISSDPYSDHCLRIVTPYLNPQLWSPQSPSLYYLNVFLKEDGKVVDNYTLRFGFRTFSVSGSKLLLNGHPYWLRGADPFPNVLCPNDSALAHKFLEIARRGNVNVTRTHIVPFNGTWLDAADEVGMGVSYEGIWPWLMLKGAPPDSELLNIWKDEYLSLMREYRNHPSIILWTVNNEMKFPELETNSELLVKKWLILNDVVKSMRQLDPTRPIVVDSSYVRKESEVSYQSVVKPNDLDDGDIDDKHSYLGWYEPSFFHFNNGEFSDLARTSNRPLISQEMSTGYPNNDDGHPVRHYLFNNYTPQALVGDYAYENADPSIFLDQQAFMTKELAETFRRVEHKNMDGVLFFSYITWFQSPWSTEQIRPWPAYYSLQTALQPVLVSAELFGRHFYAGDVERARVCIVNDSENYAPIPPSTLMWKVEDNGTDLAKGCISVPVVKYYSNRWLNIEVTMPNRLPELRVNAKLIFSLEANGQIISTNSYNITLADRNWTSGGLQNKGNIYALFPDRITRQTLAGLRFNTIDSLDLLTNCTVLIIEDAQAMLSHVQMFSKLRAFVDGGGSVLLLHPGRDLEKLFPEQISAFVKKQGEIVLPQTPESPVFSKIEPLDLMWFNNGTDEIPEACSGVYQVNLHSDSTTVLASQCDLHGYLDNPDEISKYSGAPLVEIRFGRGRVVASELCLEAGPYDPIAKRMLFNIVSYLESTTN